MSAEMDAGMAGTAGEATDSGAGAETGAETGAGAGAETGAGIADGDGGPEPGAGADFGADFGADGDGGWELDAPDDFPVPGDNLKSFSAACRGAGLSREQAERILDWHRERFLEDQNLAAQREAKVLEDWRKEILADRDFGGSNYKATVADARRALAAFDPDGRLRAFLRESRYQFNPDVIRAVARVGRAMGEHAVAGQGGSGRWSGRDRPLEERMYPNMKV